MLEKILRVETEKSKEALTEQLWHNMSGIGLKVGCWAPNPSRSSFLGAAHSFFVFLLIEEIIGPMYR